MSEADVLTLKTSQIPREWLYPESLEGAARIQKELAERVVTTDHLPQVVTQVGGVDVSNNLRDPAQRVYAVVVALSAETLKVEGVGEAVATSPIPYVPGFLGFREAPALVEAFQALSKPPDLLLVDGHGISHPRGLGIASHLGVLLDIPTIGVAKSILVGRPEGVPDSRPGAHVPLLWKGRQIGVELRTKANVKPVYVSAGHRISLETAIDWVVRCLYGYRLPEPTRQAHLAANVLRRRHLPGL